MVFFFKQKTAYELRISDWSSDVCASDLLEVDDLREIVARRTGRPLLIVDIAVPRDIDPAIGELDGVTLLDMDDLRAFADAGTMARRGEVAAVQDLLDDELDRYPGDRKSAVSGKSVSARVELGGRR